jgi:2-dehydropantoate 2-reductase
MRIVVMGAGGLGSKFGGLLAAHADVWLIHRRREHVDVIREDGLRIVRDDGEQVVRTHAALTPEEVGRADLVLMLVKSYDTGAAARAIVPLLDDRSMVITFQNGLGNLETIVEHAGPDRSVLGVTFQGATLLGPGRVLDTGRGPSYLGGPPVAAKRLEAVADLFRRASLPTEVVADVEGLLWAKLAVTAGINAVAAVLRVPNGALGRVPEAKRLSLRAVEEAMAVAQARGIRLAFDPRSRFDAVTAATARMRSGTLLDALRGRHTEIDALSGAIASAGRAVGVPTPVNEVLWMTVKAIEATPGDRVAEAG